MTFLDLFAGIGGFHLGMEQAGHQCVGWIEQDKFARKSYQAIYDVKGVWNAGDIRTIRASELPRADCWCFGFPCQDISVAGKQKGLTSGKRSSLFFTVTGLIRDLEEENRPSYLLIENVKNLLGINRGFDFLKLQIELDEIGYDIEWDVLDSAEVVPQHRERIFIVGHLRGRRTQQVFPITSDDRKIAVVSKQQSNTLTTRYGNAGGVGTYIAERKQSKKMIQRPRGNNGGGIHSIAPTMTSNSYADNNLVIQQLNQPLHQQDRVYLPTGISPALNTGTDGNLQPKVLAGIEIRKLTPLECWRLQGFPDWVFTRAQDAGLSDSQLYKQAGNSVTVPVIKAIAERMRVID